MVSSQKIELDFSGHNPIPETGCVLSEGSCNFTQYISKQLLERSVKWAISASFSIFSIAYKIGLQKI
jgi:hypothetical protein